MSDESKPGQEEEEEEAGGEEEEAEAPPPPPKPKREPPWLGIAMVVACGVLLLFVYRGTGGFADKPEVPFIDPNVATRHCGAGDKTCVIEMGRRYAVELRKREQPTQADAIERSVAALERGDCEAALKADNEIKASGRDPRLMDGMMFTKELVQACVIDDYADVLGEGGLAGFLGAIDGGVQALDEDEEEMFREAGAIFRLFDRADGGSL